MITELRLIRWKSFGDATLYVDRVTVLIGTNASGKSNALDARLFLKRISEGLSLTGALQGEQSLPAMRGGLEWVCLNKGGTFTIEVRVEGEDGRTVYVYRLGCIVQENRCDLASESLQRLRSRTVKRSNDAKPYSIYLFQTDPCAEDAASITARLYKEKRGTPRPSCALSRCSDSFLSNRRERRSRQASGRSCARFKASSYWTRSRRTCGSTPRCPTNWSRTRRTLPVSLRRLRRNGNSASSGCCQRTAAACQRGTYAGRPAARDANEDRRGARGGCPGHHAQPGLPRCSRA
ncbi:AAA family ATPase [Halochromatium glycolicum]|uniref:AAA family ATPase n=1 Tax=Halochromatium glycolicum TaxID=85075 RepID=UPI001909690B